MNQATKEALAILIRQALISAGTALGLQDLLAPDSMFLNSLVQQILAALFIAGPMIYAQVSQRFKRQKLMQALTMTEKVSEARIEAMVKDEHVRTPSVSTPKDVVPV